MDMKVSLPYLFSQMAYGGTMGLPGISQSNGFLRGPGFLGSSFSLLKLLYVTAWSDKRNDLWLVVNLDIYMILDVYTGLISPLNPIKISPLQQQHLQLTTGCGRIDLAPGHCKGSVLNFCFCSLSEMRNLERNLMKLGNLGGSTAHVPGTLSQSKTVMRHLPLTYPSKILEHAVCRMVHCICTVH